MKSLILASLATIALSNAAFADCRDVYEKSANQAGIIAAVKADRGETQGAFILGGAALTVGSVMGSVLLSPDRQ